jgi:hypothetical protein
MPLILDYEADIPEDTRPRPVPYGATQQGGPSSRPASISPATQTPAGGGAGNDGDFVPWERFVSANADVSRREANKLKASAQGRVDRAEQGREAAESSHSAALDSNYSWAGKGSGGFGGGSVGGFGNSEIEQKEIRPAQQLSPGPNAQAVGKNLEEQIGAPAWSSLVGDTARAQQSASALGSEAGVQASLGPEATGFDAALISGAGGEDFRSMAKNYGGQQLGERLVEANQDASNAWSSLMRDIDRSMADGAVASGTGGGMAGRPEVSVSPYATSPAAAVDWLSRALGGGYGDAVSDLQKFQKWARAIYGPGADLNKLKADMAKMTWEEFEAFRSGTVPEWMGNGASTQGFHGLGQTAAEKAVSDIRAAAKKAIASYSFGGGYGVNSLGNRDQFLAALASGQKYGGGGNWGGGSDPSVAQNADGAAKALGISTEALVDSIERMTDEEYQDFWLLGVIPEWMTGAKGFGLGTVGGWQSPFLKGIMGYGNDGGMWNAVANMWKDGTVMVLSGALGGPGAAAGAAVKAAEYKGPGGGK